MRRVQPALVIRPVFTNGAACENALRAACCGWASPLGRCGFFSPYQGECYEGDESFDEQGGEVLEYALIVGLIIVAAIAAITSVGTKVLAKWTSLNASM
jgi:Flp pilus assembly pilin Flp